VALAVGGQHTCALLDDGAVRCWGRNDDGRLGYAITASVGDDEEPATLGDVDVGGVAVEVVAGGVHSCARLQDGSVRCWGGNGSGTLGYGHVMNVGDDEPPSVAGAVEVL
jgi:alpha-tubulin suppressor-like RCC1 family protein